jgi:hypothetical protein
MEGRVCIICSGLGRVPLAFLIDKLLVMKKWDTIKDHFTLHSVLDDFCILEEILKEAVKRAQTLESDCFVAIAEAAISVMKKRAETKGGVFCK